jgi:hypothetical protein
MGDLEFTPQRSYRTRLLKASCVCLGLAVVCLVIGALSGDVAAVRFDVLAAAWFLLAARGLVAYAWGARFQTRLTPQGIEAHGYVTRLVPWDTIRDIQVMNSNQARRDGGQSAARCRSGLCATAGGTSGCPRRSWPVGQAAPSSTTRWSSSSSTGGWAWRVSRPCRRSATGPEQPAH